MKILVTYDGTLQAKQALRYGIFKAKATRGSLVVLHVFHSGIYVGYDSHPDAGGMARIEAEKYVKDAENIIRESGMISSAVIVRVDGAPEEEYIRMAESEKADIIITTPKYKSLTGNSPCPVSIVPGFLLVPVDGRVDYDSLLKTIGPEASASGSKVILLGVLPVNIYSKWEREEIKKHERTIKKATAVLKKGLKDEGVDAREVMVSGYPDEEILKAAKGIHLTAIIIPEDGSAPSEVRKAASLIIDEPENLGLPLLFA